jgi:hypothetical protein
VLRSVLGVHHPETLAVACNTALTLRALGREEEAAFLQTQALEELRKQLGEHNGITRVAGESRRIYRDLEPLAV